jgi:hypothetical protein
MLKRAVAVASAMLFVGFAQGQNTEPDNTPKNASSPPTILGKWSGEWEVYGRSGFHGKMELEITSVDGDRIVGQVRDTSYSPACLGSWVPLSGTKQGDNYEAHYNLGGRCQEVTATFTVTTTGKEMVIDGGYSSHHPSSGSIRLTKGL